MGNSRSHEMTKMPKQAHKEKPPDMEKFGRKQQFCSRLKWKKPIAKIVLLFPLDKRQPLAEAEGPGARARRPSEDTTGHLPGCPAAPPMLRGAGDSAERRESARTREAVKILVLLLLLDARLHEEGLRAGGGPGGGPKAAQRWQQLWELLLAESQAYCEAAAAAAAAAATTAEPPRRRCRCQPRRP